MISLMCDVWNSFLNNIRMLSPTVKGFIISGLVLGIFLFFALAINKGKNHAEKPVKWFPLFLSILCLGAAIFMVVI